jgi:L-lactate utilization protein LutC
MAISISRVNVSSMLSAHHICIIKKYILMKEEPSASKNISKNKQSGVSDARSSNGASLGLAN